MSIINKIPKYMVLFALIAFMFLGLASTTARGMLLIIFVAIMACMIRSIEYIHKPEVMGIILLLIINTIYFIFSDISRHSGFYANIILSLGIFFFSYYYSIKGKLNEKEIVITFILLMLATSYRFFVEREEMLFERGGNQGTMNLSYAFVVFMPYVFYVKNKILSIALVIFALFMVLNGAKRGAILIFLLSAVYYIYFEYIRQVKKFKYTYLVIAAIALVVSCYLMKDIYISNEYLQSRIEDTIEGNTNGREYIYRMIWGKWSTEQNILKLIFGYGFCSSMDIAGNRAHNDWLELLATAGLLGIIFYLVYMTKLIRSRNEIQDPLDRRVMTLIVLILFMKSLFSMSYCSVENMAIFLLLGFVTGRNRKRLSPRQSMHGEILLR